MRTFLLRCCLLPWTLWANTWQLYGAAGLGQHQFSWPDGTKEPQAHWALYTHASSTLYDGMDGLLRLDLIGGGYQDTSLHEGDLSIDFRAHTSQIHTRFGLGLGLGVNHQKNLSTQVISNQSFIPFYFDFKFLTGTFSRWTTSLEADVFIHIPDQVASDAFNPLRNRFILGLHYAQAPFGCGVFFRTAQFSNQESLEGLSGQRVDAVISYTFEHDSLTR